MKRSRWKGPFVSNKNVNVFSKLPLFPRNLEVTSSLVGLTGNVHSGKKLVKINVTDEMIGHKVGEFSPTRAKFVFKKNK